MPRDASKGVERCAAFHPVRFIIQGYKAMYNIINEEPEDMRLSTFVRICDNVGISLVKVLEISNSEIIDDGLSKALITCGGNRYILKRIF